MKTVGFPISRKQFERRRALLPVHFDKLKNPSQIYVEKGYGESFGYSDEVYEKAGINVVEFEEVLKQDIICDPKIGDADYLNKLNNQTIFGWVHLVQNKDITDICVNNKLTTYTWEDMFDMGRHSFWHNNQMAGVASILHGFISYGETPFGKKVAVIGRGNVATGAIKTLNQLGAEVTIYTKRTENLFKEEMDKYDVIVNALLWDTYRKDHIVSRDDLERLKGKLIIDISVDVAGAVETTVATKMDDPIYLLDDVYHYAVDHTPSILFRETSVGISEVVTYYIDQLIEDNPDHVLKDALAMENGNIIDQRIKDFQNRG